MTTSTPKSGELFELTFQTSKGPVDLLAEVVVEGKTLILSNLAVYGRSESALTGLTGEVVAARTKLIEMARSMGFERLRIIGHRAAGSSSTNPGHLLEITVDLTRHPSERHRGN